MERMGYEACGPRARAALRLRAAAGATRETLHDKVRQLPRMWFYWLRPTQLAAEEAWIERRVRAEPDPTTARRC
jgi:hypothetical protein